MPTNLKSLVTPVVHLVGPGKLKVASGRLVYSAPGRPPVRLDMGELRTLLCYGRISVTDDALRVLFASGVQVAWLTPRGTRCRGRLVRADSRSTNLRVLQHQVFACAHHKLGIATGHVTDKIRSQIIAARHYQRQGFTVGPALTRLDERLSAAQVVRTLDELRGQEGAASAIWFELLGRLLREPWQFANRVCHPPTDPVNALLSLGYTWVLTRTLARCEAVGLEGNLGALHELRPGRPSLACDLMESLRVPAVDRWVVRILNEGHLQPSDFEQSARGVRLQASIFGRSLASWEQHWSEGGHERALDCAVANLIATIRALAGDDGACMESNGAGLPDPDLPLERPGGVGESVSEDGEQS